MGKNYNTGRTWFRKGHKVNLGRKMSEETKRKIGEANKGKYVGVGRPKHVIEAIRKSNTERWEGHTKKVRLKIPRVRKTKQQLLERKRFRNMRYKAKKRSAEGSHTYEEWLLLKRKYKNICLCCKKSEPEIKLTEDHIIPLSMGGTDKIANIQPLCQACNTRKHATALTYLSVGDYGDLLASPN